MILNMSIAEQPGGRYRVQFGSKSWIEDSKEKALMSAMKYLATENGWTLYNHRETPLTGGVTESINAEMQRRINEMGVEHHEIGAWIELIRGDLEEAAAAWRAPRGESASLQKIVKVAALCVRCLHDHGR